MQSKLIYILLFLWSIVLTGCDDKDIIMPAITCGPYETEVFDEYTDHFNTFEKGKLILKKHARIPIHTEFEVSEGNSLVFNSSIKFPNGWRSSETAQILN